MTNNREFLQLAHKLSDYPRINLDGWYWSPKLDGQRAFWDGGVTRGIEADRIPWANTAKDMRLLKAPISTGLWSRYGKVIHAPDWWLYSLPPFVLDGELWIDRGKHQELRGIIGHHSGDEGWGRVKYMVFDMPHPDLVLRPGRINNPNFQKVLDHNAFIYWCDRSRAHHEHCHRESIFESRIKRMVAAFAKFNTRGVAHLVEQVKVRNREEALILTEIEISRGGEGGIIRDWMSLYEPKRIKGCLKIKPYQDDEATVVGYVWGRETDKGSKLLGLMGALIVEWRGKRFELSGFTDVERAMSTTSTFSAAWDEPKTHAGEQVSPAWSSKHFPIGSRVTFRYRELTDAGIPKEACYHRKAVEE